MDWHGFLADAEEGFFLLGEDKRLRRANASFFRLWNLPNGSDLAAAERSLLEPLNISSPREMPSRWHCLVLNGGRAWIEVRLTPFHDSSGSVLGYWGVAARGAVGGVVDRQPWREDELSLNDATVAPRSRAAERLFHQLKLARDLDAPVTLVGESGTGKETLARLLHASARNETPFAVVDCEALPPDLQRQQLFGRLDLPDPNAPEARGWLHAQGNGTIFLRHPTRLAPSLQEEVFHAFEKKTTRWRLIASERYSLEQALLDGELTEDFYWLISRFVIPVPPLRDRKADLPTYCDGILASLDRHLSPEAEKVIHDYDWPGNFRELETVLRQAARTAPSSTLLPSDLPNRIRKIPSPPPPPADTIDRPPPLDSVLESVERRLLSLALARFRGNKSKAAEFLGISRARIHRRCEQLGLASPSSTEPPE